MKLTKRSAFRIFGAALLFLSLETAVRAHDIPDEIVIQAYLRPEQAQLKLLLRIPLMAAVSTAFGILMIPISLMLALFIMILEVLVAFIQAYIFTLLTSIFIGMSANPSH